MRREDVEVARDQIEAVNELDWDRATGYYAEEVELYVEPAVFVHGGGFSGKEAVARWFGDWFGTFEPGYRFELEEVRDLGDQVLIDTTHGGRGRASGAEVGGRTSFLYTVREGEITRLELHPSTEAALRAAGPTD